MVNKILELQNYIGQQTDVLSDFVALLQRENAVLLGNPNDQDLIEITTQKNDFAKRLSNLDEKRVALLKGLGFADNNDGIGQLLNKAPSLKSVFDNLWSLADQAQAINNQNGQLLNTYLDHNQKAIDALRGLMSQGLYDASGKYKKK